MDARKAEKRSGYNREYYKHHKNEIKNRTKNYYFENREKIRLRRKRNADAIVLATEETIADISESIENFKSNTLELSSIILELKNSIAQLEIRITEIGMEQETKMKKIKQEMESKRNKQTRKEQLTYAQKDVLNALGLEQKEVPSLVQ